GRRGGGRGPGREGRGAAAARGARGLQHGRRSAGIRARPVPRGPDPGARGKRASGRRRVVRDRARAVVVGGGVGGASIAFWLTRLGWSDVVLCERSELTSGSTFHSAGLVGQLRGSLSLTRMMMRSVDLYRTLSDAVGMPTGWHEVGSLRLASSRERMEELQRQAGWGASTSPSSRWPTST